MPFSKKSSGSTHETVNSSARLWKGLVEVDFRKRKMSHGHVFTSLAALTSIEFSVCFCTFGRVKAAYCETIKTESFLKGTAHRLF